MAEIARRCGLQQSSLYYYFRNKEQVLDEIVAEANRAPLELVAQRPSATAGPPAVQLYRIIRADVVALCALPYDLNEIHRLAGRDPRGVRPLLARARRAGRRETGGDRERRRRRRRAPRRRPAPHRAHRAVERRSDPELVAGRGRRRRAGDRQHVGLGGPHAIGAFLADLTVRGLLADPARLDASGARPTRSTPRAVLDLSVDAAVAHESGKQPTGLTQRGVFR